MSLFSMLLRRLALWAVATAPASLSRAFVASPCGTRGLSATTVACDRKHNDDTSICLLPGHSRHGKRFARAGPRAVVMRGTEDGGACGTRSDLVTAGVNAVAAAVVAGTSASPAIAADREPEITSKCFIEVSEHTRCHVGELCRR